MTITAESTDSIVADSYFPALREQVISATGMVFYAGRPQALAEYLAVRLEARGLSNCHDYLDLLQSEESGDAELDQLIVLMTIGETYFFRHAELFDALRDVALPEIIDRNRSTKRLRVWSAGCSTGAEAYSVSILLRRDLAELIRGWNISILGTDINRKFLAQAAEGRFEQWAFRGTSPQLRAQCFSQHGNSWQIAPRFQDGVTFQYHNLVRHPFPSLVHNLLAFDLILCRNVLIYFAPEIIERITLQLADCLVPEGWLASGHAEHGPHLCASFETINGRGATLYRRPGPQIQRPAAGTASVPRDVAVPSVSLPGVSRSGHPAQKITASDHTPRRPHRVAATPAAREHNLTLSRCAPCPEVVRIRTLADQGEVEAALQLCESLIAKSPLNAHGYFYQGLLLDQIAGHEAALQSLNRAIYLDRQFDLAHYYLGLTQQKLGNVQGAIRSFRNVLKLLEGRDRSERLPDAEGMAIDGLEELTHMHLEMLEVA